MNLTPQLQSPDVYTNSSKNTHRQKQGMKGRLQIPVSRNTKNILSKNHMKSIDSSHNLMNQECNLQICNYLQHSL
jgi:hypothetical protein